MPDWHWAGDFLHARFAVIHYSSITAIRVSCLRRRTMRCLAVSGSTHRAFFMVRADDPGRACLEDLRGRIFGCNSLLSNSGMNLPRLSLARIAGGKPFFSSVVMTGGHVASLERLDDGRIDICSIDNVTWGFFEKVPPDRCQTVSDTRRDPTQARRYPLSRR